MINAARPSKNHDCDRFAGRMGHDKFFGFDVLTSVFASCDDVWLRRRIDANTFPDTRMMAEDQTENDRQTSLTRG